MAALPNWYTAACALPPGPELDAVFFERCLECNLVIRYECRAWVNKCNEFVAYVTPKTCVSTDMGACYRYVVPWLRERGDVEVWAARNGSTAVLFMERSTIELAGNDWPHALTLLALRVRAEEEST